MSDESLEMNFIDVCQMYRNAVEKYWRFYELYQIASSIGSSSICAPKVSEYLEVYKKSWIPIMKEFDISDSAYGGLYEEIQKLQRYEITLNSFQEFMKKYHEILDNKKVELEAELKHCVSEVEKAYYLAVSKHNPDTARLLNYSVVKEFILKDLGGIENFNPPK